MALSVIFHVLHRYALHISGIFKNVSRVASAKLYVLFYNCIHLKLVPFLLLSFHVFAREPSARHMSKIVRGVGGGAELRRIPNI